MVAIRGPRSALTDFIKEHGLNIQVTKKESNPEIKSKKEIVKKNKNSKLKRIRKSMPFELTNIEQDTHEISIEDTCFIKMIDEIEKYNKTTKISLNDDELKKFSAYLCKNRKMNGTFFKFLIDNCNEKLFVYDCSSINNEQYFSCLKHKINKLTELHLNFCGQLKKETINKLLAETKIMKSLTIMGAFIVDDFILPRSIEILDVSNCSRLENSFIERINNTFSKLDTLNLEKCYKLNESCELDIIVHNLNVAETKLSYNFIKKLDLQKIKSLNISMCPLFYPIDTEQIHPNFIDLMKNKQNINIEGISTIKSMEFTKNLKSLNIKNCFIFEIMSLDCNSNIEHLNVSKINISSDDIKFIACNFKKLKSLDVSWNENINDTSIISLVESLTLLESIYVFGCFDLTEKIGEYAWCRKKDILIVGNPAETRFLLK